MEIEKMLNILIDLTNEEKNLRTNELISSLITFIGQNDSQSITTTLNDLRKGFDESVVNQYSFSNHEILENISGDDYFGKNAIKKIEAILSKNSFNIDKTSADLKKYIAEREIFLNTINSLYSLLSELGFYPHYSDKYYEVGLLLPKSVTGNKILTITKELNQWDKIVKNLKEIIGDSPEDTEITFVSNGSIDFFFESGPEVALCLALILEKVAAIYKKVLEVREARLKLKNLGAPTSEDKQIEKHEKELFANGQEEIVKQIIKQFLNKSIDAGRVNELKVMLKGHVLYIAKSLDKGIIIEINPPEIPEPKILGEKETEQNKAEKAKIEKEYKEKLANLEVVKHSLDLVKEVIGLGEEVFKHLPSGEENNSNPNH